MLETLPLPMLAQLRDHGGAAAVITDEGPVSYTELADLVEAATHRFGGGRRLVGLAMTNDLASVVHYLAALAAGHAVVLASPCQLRAVASAVGPSVTAVGGEVTIHPGRSHDLHPDLALLLSTSGSTGSPKLVRLSYGNLHSNAAAIAQYLAIRPTDVAVTTLPLHYCYGLSVLHSHLLAGAAVRLTAASVADPGFASLLDGVTTLPGVPHTFELLARTQTVLPATLRTVTQAGGRMRPEQVRAWAQRGQAQGFDFFVMYGQTEATARMLYLPPDLAAANPSAVGMAIPGGSVRIDDGELVYTGPNVMMGYATATEHLAAGPELPELRTGDLARITDAGLVEILGRKARFAKIMGLRIDLAAVESQLADAGRQVWCMDGEDRVLAACLDDPDAVRPLLCRAANLPASAVHVQRIVHLPRTPSGKPDYPALRGLLQARAAASGSRDGAGVPAVDSGQRAAALHGLLRARAAVSGSRDGAGVPAVASGQRAAALRGWVRARAAVSGQRAAADVLAVATVPRVAADVLAAVLGRERSSIGPDDTFASLGGDSLSYVAAAAALEQLLGTLPPRWHLTPVRDLVPAQPPRRWLRRMETTVVLRAVAILAVVASHIGVIDVRGGAHLLIAVAGWNFARFRLAGTHDPAARVRTALRTVARIALPASLYLAVVAALGTEYGSSVVFGVNLFGPDGSAPEWRYWYLEALLFVLLAAIAAIGLGHRVQRRWPYGFALAALGAGLLGRFAFAAEEGPGELYTPVVVGWLFAAGWALAVARHRWQTLLALALVGVGMIGYFDDPRRAAFVVAGVLLFVFAPTLPVPAFMAPAIGMVAAASMWIYLTHWQTYPPVAASGWGAVVVAVAAGVIAWQVEARVLLWWRGRRGVGAGPGGMWPRWRGRGGAGADGAWLWWRGRGGAGADGVWLWWRGPGGAGAGGAWLWWRGRRGAGAGGAVAVATRGEAA